MIIAAAILWLNFALMSLFVFLTSFLGFLGHLLNGFEPCGSFRHDFLLLCRSPVNEVVGYTG